MGKMNEMQVRYSSGKTPENQVKRVMNCKRSQSDLFSGVSFGEGVLKVLVRLDPELCL